MALSPACPEPPTAVQMSDVRFLVQALVRAKHFPRGARACGSEPTRPQSCGAVQAALRDVTEPVCPARPCAAQSVRGALRNVYRTCSLHPPACHDLCAEHRAYLAARYATMRAEYIPVQPPPALFARYAAFAAARLAAQLCAARLAWERRFVRGAGCALCIPPECALPPIINSVIIIQHISAHVQKRRVAHLNALICPFPAQGAFFCNKRQLFNQIYVIYGANQATNPHLCASYIRILKYQEGFPQ